MTTWQGAAFLTLTAALACAACGDDGQTTTGTATGTASGTGGSQTGAGGSPSGTGGSTTGTPSGAATGTGTGGPNPCATISDDATAFDVDGQTHCYWLVSGAVPQLQADCGPGAYLATAQSQAENDHLAAFTATASPLWIGLRCDAAPPAACTNDPSNYMWLNGEPLGYQGWAAGEPATPRGAAMHADGWRGYDTLNNQFGYLCESPAP